MKTPKITITSRIRATRDWIPQYDNLDTIAAHALAWEEKLLNERGRLLHHTLDTQVDQGIKPLAR